MHWWSHSVAPICLPQPGPKSVPPPPPSQAMTELRTHLMIRELIRKRWQWAFTTLNFHQPIFQSPVATQSMARETDVGCLWMIPRLLEEEIRGPFAPDSSLQRPRPTPYYKPSYITHPQVREQECSRIHTLHTDTQNPKTSSSMITVPSPLHAVLSLFCLARHP